MQQQELHYRILLGRSIVGILLTQEVAQMHKWTKGNEYTHRNTITVCPKKQHLRAKQSSTKNLMVLLCLTAISREKFGKFLKHIKIRENTTVMYCFYVCHFDFTRNYQIQVWLKFARKRYI